MSLLKDRLDARQKLRVSSLFQRTAIPVGVDIGRRRVRVAAFVMGEAGPTVSRLLDSVLPAGMITSEGIIDPEGVAEEVARLIESAGIRRGRAAVAVAGGDVFLRRVPMPRTSRQEALRQVQANPSLRPSYLDIESTKIEIDILDKGEGNRPMQILMAVAKRDAIRARQRVVLDAGLALGAVDVDSCALFNLFRHCRPELSGQRCTLVHIGDEWSLVTVIDERGLEVARRADIGVATLVAAMIEAGFQEGKA
ncbi:MAG TPA: pilus assembly protein PilM, partial [Gemmatimonadaceae bacterium]